MSSSRVNYSSETKLEKEALYSRMVKVHPYVMVGGTTAIDEKGVVHGLGDSYAQVHYVISRQIKMLEVAGASKADIVKLKISVTPDFDSAGVRAFTELLGDVKPLSTLVVVAGLFRPELLVEIEMDAIIGCGDSPTQELAVVEVD